MRFTELSRFLELFLNHLFLQLAEVGVVVVRVDRPRRVVGEDSVLSD